MSLSATRLVRSRSIKTIELVSTVEQVYQGGIACLKLSTGLVKKGAPATDLIPIGLYVEDKNAGSGDKVLVDLFREIRATWYANSTDAVTTAQIGSLCYIEDDNTVSKTDNGGTRSVAGRVWGIDSVKGVLVESLMQDAAEGGAQTLANAKLDVSTIPAYTANDSAPATILSGAIYDVPTQGAASTITLPASPPDGTWAVFTADGTKNGFTTTYRDATGPTNLTTALIASKRHEVIVTALGGKWFANAYVGP